MSVITQTIRVDLNTGKVIPTAFVHQNDTARSLVFDMYLNGEAFNVSSYTVKFAYVSPTVNGQHTVISGNSMASGLVSDNKVTVTLPSAYTAISGVGLLTMIITPSSGTIRPVNIRFVVQKSADGDDQVMGASDFPESLYDYMDNWMEENEPTEIANLKSDLNGIGAALGFDESTMVESSSFISGTRKADGYITHNSRCTTNRQYHLTPRHKIAVTGVSSNIKYAIAGVNNGSYILDSGWLTEDAERYISVEGDYFVNVTTISESGTLSPSDFDLTVTIAPVFSDITQMRADIGNMTGNKIYSAFDFRFCGYDATGTDIDYGSATFARCTAVCEFDEPQYVAINHHDYTLGIYWKENNVLHNKTYSPCWEVPANVKVAIVIRRSETSENPESMMGETPWVYLFTRTLNDKPRRFYDSEIADTLEKISLANTEPSLCFTLSTDHHYMTTINWLNNYDSISDMTANMKALGESVNFDFNISLGDIADFKAPYSTSVADRFGIKDTSAQNLDAIFSHWREYAMYRLKNVNQNFIYVHGNHDDNRYLRIDSGASGYDYTADEMYSYYMSNAYKTLSGSNPNNLLEYYFDVENLGIRVIILDSNYDNGSGWDYGFSDSTAEWLEEILGASDNKQVLIFSHMSPIYTHNGDNYEYHNFTEVANVIETWKNNGGDLIAIMYGHSHVDWSTASPWLDITFCCQKIHQIPSSDLFSNMPDCVAPTRTFGTASEDCWNVVIIKPKSRKINIIRFGAGDDREFTY